VDEYEILLQYTVEISYNVITASIFRVVITEERDVLVNSDELIGAIEYLSVWTRYRIPTLL